MSAPSPVITCPSLRAEDTYGAQEESPKRVKLLEKELAAGVVATEEVKPGTAMAIATGGMIPRGADALLMVEHSEVDGDQLIVRRAVTPGAAWFPELWPLCPRHA